MSEGTTCYERDEQLCEDQMCLRVGCRIRNEKLSPTPNVVTMETAARLIREAREKRKARDDKALADVLATIESDLITVEVFKHAGIDDLEV